MRTSLLFEDAAAAGVIIYACLKCLIIQLVQRLSLLFDVSFIAVIIV